MTRADQDEKARLKSDSKRYGHKRALQRQRDRLYGARAESQACQDIAREFVNVAKRRGFKASASRWSIG